jgi:CRP/FNR family transcriptional regulator, cyclic AMP receptor protein
MTTVLDGLPLLTGLSSTQRAAVAGISTIETYDSTTSVSGRVALQSLGHGELVGWSWVVPPHRWHFGATVVSPTRAVVVDAVKLRELAEADPELGYRVALVMVGALVERLQTTRTRLLELQHHS